MRAVVVEQAGGPEVLTEAERPDPTPGPGQVVVQLAYAGVNFKDVYEREGRTRLAPPFVPGCEGAGTVLELGPEVSGVAVGDRVAWWAAPGSYAERVVVAADATVPLPADITEADAAAVLLQGLTAHYLTTSTYRAGEGESALVHAAAGGLGQHLTRLLAARGVQVLATVSTQAKAEVARAAGAHEVIVGADPSDLAPLVRKLTGSRGVDVVYDGIGLDTFKAGLESLRPRGTFVLVGAASGPAPTLDPQSLAALGSLFLTRPTLVDYATDPAELRSRAAELFDWMRTGAIQVAIGGRYTFAQAHQAHADLQSRRTTGKLLLTPA